MIVDLLSLTFIMLSLGSYVSVIIMFVWWWPLVAGLSLNKSLLLCQCVVSKIGFNLGFFPMYYFGLCGLPRRVCIYEVGYKWINVVCTAASFITAFSACIFVFILWESVANFKTVIWFWGAPSVINNFVYSPVVGHGNFFAYCNRANYTWILNSSESSGLFSLIKMWGFVFKL